MKYIITENQLKVLIKEDRVEFLRGQNVIDPKILDKSVEGSDEKDDERLPGDINPNKEKVTPIQGHDGIDIAYIITNKKGKKSIKLTEQIFNDIVAADPSSNKQYVQWIIRVFMDHVNEGDTPQAVRFLTEDLPEVSEFLGVFDTIKDKKLFKRAAPNRPNAPQNVRDINQYKDLSHLYSIVSPFIGTEDEEEDENGDSQLWLKLKKYIDLGEAKLAYRDGDVLVYTPLSRDSSCEPLGSLASWCTRREGNSYFDSYRRDHPKPDGSLSDYYVIMPKKLFKGDDEGDLYPLQFHFQSGQLHDKTNKSIEPGKGDGRLDGVLNRFPGMRNFFLKELGALLNADIKNGNGLIDSQYMDYINMFGGSGKDYISPESYKEGLENIKKLAAKQDVPLVSNKYLKWLLSNEPDTELVDFIDNSVEKLDFSGIRMTELPDLSKFTNVKNISAENCGLKVTPSGDKLPRAEELKVISLKNNDIKEANFNGWAAKFPKIFALNINDNPIKTIDFEGLTELTNPPNDLMIFRISLDGLDPEVMSTYESWVNDGKLGNIKIF